MKALACAAFVGVSFVAFAQPIGGAVDYMAGDVKCQGYLAYDASKQGKRPGVLIVHDWDGLNAYEEGRAMQIAKLGYVAFCVDVYGKGVRPLTPQDNAAASGRFKADRTLFRERLKAGLDELRKDPNVDPNRIAAIGYCFGGTGVLEMARAGMEVDGVVSFHGGLDAAPGFEAKSVSTKVLVLHGDADPFVPPAQVEAFKKEFAQASLEFVGYPGVVHSFTQQHAGSDASKGAAYDANADADSWSRMKAFLAALFGG